MFRFKIPKNKNKKYNQNDYYFSIAHYLLLVITCNLIIFTSLSPYFFIATSYTLEIKEAMFLASEHSFGRQPFYSVSGIKSKESGRRILLIFRLRNKKADDRNYVPEAKNIAFLRFKSIGGSDKKVWT